MEQATEPQKLPGQVRRVAELTASLAQFMESIHERNQEVDRLSRSLAFESSRLAALHSYAQGVWRELREIAPELFPDEGSPFTPALAEVDTDLRVATPTDQSQTRSETA